MSEHQEEHGKGGIGGKLGGRGVNKYARMGVVSLTCQVVATSIHLCIRCVRKGVTEMEGGATKNTHNTGRQKVGS